MVNKKKKSKLIKIVLIILGISVVLFVSYLLFFDSLQTMISGAPKPSGFGGGGSG